MITKPMASAVRTLLRAASLRTRALSCWVFWGGSLRPGLAEIATIRVVKEMETQRQVLSTKFRGKGREWVGSGDAAPCRAVERNIARGGDQAHALHAAILHNCELNRDLALFHQRGARHLGDQV